MPRTAKPQWHKTRHYWYANIGPPDKNGRATEAKAPKELGLGPKDEPKAWEWMGKELARLKAEESPIDSGELTVAGLAEAYLAWTEARKDDGKMSKGQHENKGYHLSHFSDALGECAASTVTPQEMESFIADLQNRKLSANYIDNICATVSAMFNWAVPRHFATNPIKGFEAPVVPRSPERFAERIEAALWLRHFWRRSEPNTPERRYDRLTTLMQRILIRSGARPGELCCMLWTDIKWTGWENSLGQTCARATISPERWKTGKITGKPRTIFFSPVLTRALRREHDRKDRHPTAVFIKGAGRGGIGDGEPWPDSSRLARKVCDVRREIIDIQKPILEKIKAKEEITEKERKLATPQIFDEGPNRLVNYRWRHTAISSLLMMGVDVITVAELTGTSSEMIHKTYGHLLDHHLQEAAEKLTVGYRPKKAAKVKR